MSDFQWIKERFDKVDGDNKAIAEELSIVRQKVDRHGVYWDVTKYAVPIGVASLLSWLGLKK